MMDYKYRLRADRIKIERAEVTVFGLDIVGERGVIRSIPDIFTDQASAESLVRLCNRCALAPEQIDDVIEDAIASV